MKQILALGAFIKRRQILLHPVRSMCFIKALMKDERIHISRKVVFSVLVVTMLGLLLFPDVIEETLLSSFLPILGTLLGLPLGLGFDWAAFAMLSVWLLRLFPADVVNEHYSMHILNSPVIDANKVLIR